MYQRPIAGGTRNTSAREAVVDIAFTRTASPFPVITNAAGVIPPTAEKTRLRVFQSWYFGNEAGQVGHDGWVPYTATSRSGSG